jgi:hypothetical protein
VQGCLFQNVSLLPSPHQHGPARLSNKTTGGAGFIRTAVIVVPSDARMPQSTFEDCYTPAVVYASGEDETSRRVDPAKHPRPWRNLFVSLILHESKFVRNMYGVYADGFQVIVSNCSFAASTVSGVKVSGAPCLVINGSKLHGASVSVQRASDPGVGEFSFCRMGWFPFWQNVEVQAPNVPTAGNVEIIHNISERVADMLDSPVSV